MDNAQIEQELGQAHGDTSGRARAVKEETPGAGATCSLSPKKKRPKV